MTQSVNKLSSKTRFFHVVVAFSMIAVIALGIYMEEFEAWALYDLHKSIGALVLVVALVRVFVRLSEGWPEPAAVASKAQACVARLIHWLLILATLVFPLSGAMMSGAGGHGIFIFGLEIMAENIDPVSGKSVPVNEFIAGLGSQVHSAIVWVVIGAILLHIAGALKHHFIDKDDTIKRMF
ncbi:cytochrome b [Thalassotalea sp. PLHSN55]|uniref:cytochrome b n=1 Tax=Thalassotalea sp. PLHSN55 TaxID=3435888 RepID=UPI003F85F595